MLSEPVVPRGPLGCFPQQTHREPVLLWTLMELVYIPILTGCVSLGKCLAPLCLIFLLSGEANTLLNLSQAPIPWVSTDEWDL